MACCQKRRKAQVKKLMNRRIFEAESYKLLRNLKEKDPSTLQDILLNSFHLKTHKLYKGAVKHKPPNKKFINHVVSLHNEYVAEMKKRGLKHDTHLTIF